MTVSEPSEVQGERWIVRNGEIRTDGPPYHCVASITITNNDVEHADARARLIAAAPDMLAALKAHQLWEKREKEGPLYPFGMKRDDPGGEQIWRAWWDDQMRLCALSHELTDAAIRAALQAQGMRDERA